VVWEEGANRSFSLTRSLVKIEDKEFGKTLEMSLKKFRSFHSLHSE